jgi:DNA-directed RNA polymerase subunit M/transcription elongation factor TFIIS
MAIEVNCPNCSKLLKAKDALAGRTVKCPGCGSPVEIPSEEIYDAEVDEVEAVEDGGFPDIDDSDQPAIEEPPKRPCPMCGENIPVAAKKCRFCGETFGKKKRKSGSRSSSSEDDEMTVVDWILCFCCPGIGCIIGIIRACQGKSSGGKIRAFLEANGP